MSILDLPFKEPFEVQVTLVQCLLVLNFDPFLDVVDKLSKSIADFALLRFGGLLLTLDKAEEVVDRVRQALLRLLLLVLCFTQLHL